MNTLSRGIDLHALDAYRPALLSAETWNRNLAAVRCVDPILADTLSRIVLPPSWRAALALDDSPTWRLEDSEDPPRWLGGTAAPRTRATALLKAFGAADQNLALPSLEAGAELAFLLETTPNHVAIFAFDDDPQRVVAVLRICDFSAAIRAGRCILISGDDERSILQCRLDASRGLLPPNQLLLGTLVKPERFAAIRDTCTQVANDVSARRAARVAQIAAKLQDERRKGDVPRLAILQLAAGARHAELSNRLSEAAQCLGWEVLTRTIELPDDAHSLAHLEPLAEFGPEITLCVNHAQRLPAVLPGFVCLWLLDPPSVGALNGSQAPAALLAATPRVAAAAREVAVDGIAVLDWPVAVSRRDLGDAGPALRINETPRLLLFGDLPDDRAKECGIEQPTHKMLWSQLRIATEQTWETARILRPDQLLHRIEAATGIRLGDVELERNFTELIRSRLTPAVALEQFARAAIAEGWRVDAIGAGWERLSAHVVGLCVSGAVATFVWAGGNEHGPSAALFACHPDPLSTDLVRVAAAGVPIAVWACGGAPLGGALGEVLQVGVHLESIGDRGELRRFLRAVGASAPAIAQRAVRARAHLAARHTYEIRLQTLLETLNSGPMINPTCGSEVP